MDRVGQVDEDSGSAPPGDRPNRLRWLLLVAGLITGVSAGLALSWWVIRLTGANDPLAAPTPPRFVDETISSGVASVYDGDFEFFVGGGVAVFDCNDDGRPDLYFAGGSNPSQLYENVGERGGELEFAEVHQPETAVDAVTGAYPIDIDSDGVTDLAVLRLGENQILRGKGSCRFERANETWGIDGGNEWTVGFSATWETGNNLPTLAFGNYVAIDDSGSHTNGECSDNYLIRPDGPDRYGEPRALTPGWCTLSILFSDWDRTGRADLRMTNDRHYYRAGEEQLWRVPDGKTPRLYGREDGWEFMSIWGMGIASEDLTGDGRPEVFLTSQGDNKLQTLSDDSGRPTYVDIALSRGANAHRPFTGEGNQPSTAWHAEFDDVNNDGLIDLFVSKGNVDAMSEFAAEDPNNLLLGRGDGSFVEAAEAAGILDLARTRGAAVTDLNLDGLLDLVVVDRREPARLWRNVGAGTASQPAAMGGFLDVGLRQDGPNPSGVGAWIDLDVAGSTLTREVTIGGGHAGGELGPIHFGLGDADEARLRVHWPDGEVSRWMDVDADERVAIIRGTDDLVPLSNGTE